MTEKILATVAAFIIAVISAGGYGGITLLMAIESACIPLPSEIIMPFSGYLVSTGQLGLIGVRHRPERSAATSARFPPMRWENTAGGRRSSVSANMC